MDVGVGPLWTPRSVADRLLVWLCTALFHLLLAPFLFVHLLLGWSKLDWVLLDVLSVPGSLLRVLGMPFGAAGRRWGLRANALEHTFLVCRLCPARRRALRDPTGKGMCVWNHRWDNGEFDITPNFGGRNWLTQYAGRTDLADYRELAVAGNGSGKKAPPRSFGLLSVAVSILLNAALLVLLLGGSMGCSYLATADMGSPKDWADLGAVPKTQEKYPPQGLTLVGEHLVFTNHWKDTKSGLYKLDPADMSVVAESEMPARATHTSGLAWDGTDLFAVDYETGEIFRLDLDASFANGQAVVKAAYPTSLKGASAAAILKVDNTPYIAVSDFLGTSRTYIAPLDRLSELGDKTMPDIAVASYPNRSFSQGLTFDGEYLYEAVNARGDDRVEVLDVLEAVRNKDSNLVRHCGSFAGPAPSIEDLANDGTTLWTSDEITYRFYKLTDFSGTARKLCESAE